MSEVQSYLFDKSRYTTKTARLWLHKYNKVPIKRVHVTDAYYRYRMKEPIRGKEKRTIIISEGIKAIIELR